MKKHLGLIFLIFFAVGAIAFYFSKGNLLNYLLKPYFEAVSSQLTGLKVSIKKMDLSLLNTSLEIYDIHVKTRNSKASKHLIDVHIPRLSASIQLQQLFLGQIALKKVHINSPRAHIKLSDIITLKKKKREIKFNIPWTPILSFDFKEIEITKGQLTVERKDFKSHNPNVELTIKADKHKKYYISASSLKSTLSQKKISAVIDKASISGSITPPLNIEGGLMLTGTTFQNESYEKLTSNFSFERRFLRITDFLFTPKTGDLTANALFEFNESFGLARAELTMNEVPFLIQPSEKKESGLTIESQALDLEKLITKSIKVKGTGSFLSHLYVKDKTIQTKTQLELKNTFVEGVFVGNTKGSVAFLDKQLKANFQFHHPKSKAQGQLTSSLRLSEEKWTGQGKLEANNFRYLNEDFLKLSIPFNVKRGGLQLPNVQLHKKRGLIEATGFLSTKKRIQLSVKSKNLKLEEFSQLPAFVGGNLQLEAQVKGTTTNPTVNLTTSMNDTFIEGKKMGSSIVKASLINHKAIIQADFFDEKLSQKAVIKLQNKYHYTTRLVLNDFDFTPYFNLFHRRFLDLIARLSGNINLEGDLRGKKITSGDVQIQNIKVSSPQFEFHNKGPIRATAKNGKYTLQSLWLQGTDTELKARGHISPKGEISFSVEGPTDFQLLHLLIPSVQKSSGQAKIFSRISGTVQKPQLFGNILLQNGGVKLDWFPNHIQNIDANISFSQNKISVDKFNSTLGEGRLEIFGDIFLADKDTEINLGARLSECFIQFPKWLYNKISGELFFRGKGRPYVFSGKILSHEALYKENIDWQSKIVSFRKERRLPKVQEVSKPLFIAEISINAPKNIHINNNLGLLEVKADMKLIGDERTLSLIGNIELISGVAYFKNTTFNLTSATARFNNVTEINPDFLIHAETTIKDYKILMTMEGLLTDYKVTLTSEPALEDLDIVSLLTLGAVREDIEDQSILNVTSLELGSFLFGGIQEKIQAETKKTFGITFHVSPSYSDTKHATVPRLFVSKTLGKKVDVTFSSTLDKTSIFADKELNLKYNINRSLSLITFWEDLSDEELQDNSSVGVDVKAQIEFK